MLKQLHLNDYKQEIADLYSRRSPTYDTSDWHLQIARRLVEYGQVSSGQRVLDIATGTGHAAVAAAEIVGDTGAVVGIDISPGMLDRARQKALSLWKKPSLCGREIPIQPPDNIRLLCQHFLQNN